MPDSSGAPWRRKKMKTLTRLVFALFVVLAFVGVATAQTPQSPERLTITPLFENGTYNRTYNSDPSSGYHSTGLRSDTMQKGFTSVWHGTGNLSTVMQIMWGVHDTPTFLYHLTDGQRGSMPYNQASNTMTEFTGESRRVEFTEAYTQGLVTYRFGISYNLLTHTDAVTFLPSTGIDQVQSKYVDSFAGPQFGLTIKKRIHRLSVGASFDGSPWMHHTGTYKFSIDGDLNADYRATTSSKGFKVGVESIVSLTNNLGALIGWRYESVRTDDAAFVTPTPGRTPFPATDTWRGIYMGLEIRR